MDWGLEAQDRLNEIAGCSLTGPGVTRFPFTPEHAAARKIIEGWMTRAGLEIRLDAAGTLIGRTGPADAPAFLIGSHQDSVRGGGQYDGIMGVALACLAIEALNTRGTPLPCAIEVLAFADEEGVRFPTALLGPRALAGTVDPEVFTLEDRDGISLGTALDAFGGAQGDVVGLARDPGSVLGYLEIHIEQGPALEQADQPLGVVTGICGIERNAVRFAGQTGHAGTVPMEGRRDALVAAADFVTAIHDTARNWPGLRATIGSISVFPDVVNAIPSEARLTLEIRHEDDRRRADFHAEAREIGAAIAQARNTGFGIEQTYAQPAVPCDPALVAALEQAAPGAPRLPSGATHDASAMADLCPVVMLFVRCRGGISHRPEEFASADDMGAAVDAAARFLAALPNRD
ncbi:M20 family metallo-hydrolase [Ponticoccus sp. SC2-23]|uniref:M20 family metallo-hydrolase n=1 Tax=Alexandriicola marinus TaxID=2081710 RepID=UPI000FD9C547|nr:M20 family metallo-hydrolase [Alexandriicola marinus]MBM1219520.1 M20 family metallo-hydrolase [Ponticoccus sp. SC6-9]MBM1223408.1 M20 family metallo-hydrolase [Ponticoccus sp. SC6-15]MBM1229333.1 M20 family metallo-hydrolase [Ponticoccus sp. SC6-38]MBM1232374.1 M20 family metallo-hydrolase [Ponticoccus sp. SC6-45]MBM1237676.1 M20 family metallo-hydrolase [Ponticoccus sp. SC6-49]MBM1241385.1 M20 family metallo-hydrolase [Ponticoccus sp. SC2-64]MBM1245898.1 M20 family metallo-hydrolase [Po